MAFVGYAIGRETLLEAHRKRSRHNFTMIASELEALKAQGLIRADVDCLFEAKTILAMIDGFGLNLVLDPEGFGSDLSSQKFEVLISSLIVRLQPAKKNAKT
jgi:BetI-type transcriptional repressor, C-terminal